MKVVFQYLKPFAFILLLCVLLLFGQALSDLESAESDERYCEYWVAEKWN